MGGGSDVYHTMLQTKKNNHGFTLIEILLSVAAIMIIGSIAIPVYQSFQVRNDLDIAATTIAQTQRRAQILAQASDGDISWGIRRQPGSVILFQGASYATRDVTKDEIFEIPASITMSGISELVFAKFTGMPTITGTIGLTSTINETRTVTINAKGTITY